MKKSFSILLLTVLFFCSSSQAQDEEAAIKKVLEKESATWRSGDVKGHADCWHIQPYSRILVSTGDGTAIDVPPAAMINPAKMGNGGSSANTNYKMSINGNSAWVSHDETSTAQDGSITYSYEIRMLEKIDGEWKLVGQSIHIYKPKK